MKMNDEKIGLNFNPNTKLQNLAKEYEMCKQKCKQIFIVISMKT